MPFQNFGGNNNKYCNLSDMNFFMKNWYSDPDPFLFNCGSEDPDPLFPNVDHRIRIHVKMRWIRNAGLNNHNPLYVHLGIHNVGLDLLLMLLVGDAEAVGHLDALLVHASNEGPYHP